MSRAAARRSARRAVRRGPRRRSRRSGLSVGVSDERGRASPHGRGLGAWLAGAAPRQARGVVSIALVSDAAIRRLNREFRGVDRATDVLSFGGPGPGACLGDIAIAVGVARRQARDMGHSVPTEIRILALHGLLHLLGYDHEADQGAMGRLEDRLRRRAGLPSALIARASRSGARR